MDRVRDRRSRVGKVGLKVVVDFLHNDLKKTGLSYEEYMAYALRADGPALYGIPSPLHCVDKAAKGYIVRARRALLCSFIHMIIQKPKQLFESSFIIAVLTDLLPYAGKYRSTSGINPSGAVGLAAASVSDAHIVRSARDSSLSNCRFIAHSSCARMPYPLLGCAASPNSAILGEVSRPRTRSPPAL
jgi:hypothetical protein